MFQRGERGSYMPHRAGCVDEWQRKGREGCGEDREKEGRKEGKKEKRTVAEQEL